MKRATFSSYFFHRSYDDIVEDVLDRVLDEVSADDDGDANAEDDVSGLYPEGTAFSGWEEEVLRERDRLLFKVDVTMQEIFDGDFDAYWQALQNDPERLRERLLEERGSDDEDDIEIQTHLRWGRSWEQTHDSDAQDGDAQDGDVPTSDHLYTMAYEWAAVIHKTTTTLYFDQEEKDIDVFRAHVNVVVAPAKIMWANAVGAMQDSDTMAAVQGYQLSLLFVHRTLQALKALQAKDIGDTDLWEDCFGRGIEIAALLEHRIKLLEDEEQ